MDFPHGIKWSLSPELSAKSVFPTGRTTIGKTNTRRTITEKPTATFLAQVFIALKFA